MQTVKAKASLSVSAQRRCFTFWNPKTIFISEEGNDAVGANIAGFEKVVDAMTAKALFDVETNL